jgi:SAM-dependent methyltransferase
VIQPYRIAPHFRDLVLIAVAFGPAALGIFLLWDSSRHSVLPIALALSGALLAGALVLRSARDGRPGALRAGARLAEAGAWDRFANPAGNFANRWAMYQDLTEWLRSRDWRGKTVAEFGRSNEVLRSFLGAARYTLLEYPAHDVQDLKGLASSAFDLVILDQTLEHVADPERALSEVARILQPGGVALVTTPFLVPLHATELYGDYTRWSPQGLARLLERHGFEADVRWWGNLAAARELLAHMHLKADQAMALRLPIDLTEREERFPITLWAVATLEGAARVSLVIADGRPSN